MTIPAAPGTSQTFTLTAEQWQGWLASLAEVGQERLLPRAELSDGELAEAEAVDEYVLSAYAEAMQSEEVDGELWDTYADLELEGASSDEQAWAEILAFYLGRGCCLARVAADSGEGWAEEWLLAPELAQRLDLPRWAALAGGSTKDR